MSGTGTRCGTPAPLHNGVMAGRLHRRAQSGTRTRCSEVNLPKPVIHYTLPISITITCLLLLLVAIKVTLAELMDDLLTRGASNQSQSPPELEAGCASCLANARGNTTRKLQRLPPRNQTRRRRWGGATRRCKVGDAFPTPFFHSRSLAGCVCKLQHVGARRAGAKAAPKKGQASRRSWMVGGEEGVSQDWALLALSDPDAEV